MEALPFRDDGIFGQRGLCTREFRHADIINLPNLELRKEENLTSNMFWMSLSDQVFTSHCGTAWPVLVITCHNNPSMRLQILVSHMSPV